MSAAAVRARRTRLALKAALVEIGYATWDDVEVVQNACELKDARDEG